MASSRIKNIPGGQGAGGGEVRVCVRVSVSEYVLGRQHPRGLSEDTQEAEAQLP